MGLHEMLTIARLDERNEERTMRRLHLTPDMMRI